MNTDKIEDILKTIGAEDIPADVQRIAEQTSIDFDKTLTQSRQPRQYILLEYLAKSQITRLAAAAVMVIGVLFALNIIGNGGGVAWGEVLDNVKKVQSYINRMKMTLTAGPKGSQDVELTFYRSTQYGTRRDSYFKDELISKLYVPAEGNKGVEVLPTEKKYVEVVFSDQQLKEMAEKNDPREIVKEFMSCSYTELDSKTIDGIEVEGIEVDDPNFGSALFERGKGRLWVDVETDLPVLIELEGVSAGGSVQINMVVDQFDWNADLQASDFEPNIPSDYTVMAKVDLSGNVEAVIKGLRGFARITSGRYPSNLDLMTTSKEIREAFIALRQKEGKSLDEKPTREEMENILPIQGTCLFYGKLVKENKDVAYYGDKVTTEFPHAVLMRWKIEDGKYRIIFADLTTRDVTAEELAQLEAMPLNTKPRAIKPQPTDGAEGTTLTGLKLSWMPGANVNEHKVYFGTSIDNMSLLRQVTTDYAGLPVLERDTTYYWRVDEVQPEGSVATGDIWSFNTGRLVAWWKLDGGSGNTAVDSSGNAHNGTLLGDTSWVDGIDGAALAFDGDGDYVDIGKDQNFDITNQITISAWIKVSAFDREWQTIVAKGDGAWRLQRNWGESTLEFACSGLVVPGSDWGQIYGNTDVNDGHWHHVAGVYDQEKLYLYIDGNLDASAEAPGTIRVNDEPVYIGENSQMPNRFWNGLIDDVRIYSYALSTEEISEIAKKALLLSLPK